MKSSRLYRKIYSIGGKPALRVSSDSREIFGYIELCPDESGLPDTEANTTDIFILSKSYGEIDLMKNISGGEIFTHPNVKIFLHNGIKLGDWYGKAISITNARYDLSIILFPGYRHYLRSFFYRMIFRPIVDTILINKGYLLFHASAVAKKDSGCIIAGETGAGKSTIAKELVTGGYFFLGDDRAVLHSERPFQILSYPEYICCPKKGSPDKRMFETFRERTHAKVKSVILIAKSDDKSPFKITKLCPAEAAARLILHSRISIDEKIIDERRIGMISRICQKTDCYLLSGSGPVSKKVAMVKELIGESS